MTTKTSVLEPRTLNDRLEPLDVSTFTDSIGMELEGLVLDKDFKTVPLGYDLVQELQRQGYNGFETEGDDAQVELITKPGTAPEVFSDLVKQLDIITEIAESQGNYFLPISAPLDNYEPHTNLRKPRYVAIEKVFVKPGSKSLPPYSGQHTHFLLDDNGRRAHQLNYLTVSIPMKIALTSASPQGPFANARVPAWEDYFGEFPFQGGVQSYVSSYDEYLARLGTEFEKFKDKAAEKGVDLTGLVTMYNGIWGPVRVKDHDDFITAESRIADSTPDIMLMLAENMTALGGMRRTQYSPLDEADLILPDVTDAENMQQRYERILRLKDKAVLGIKDNDLMNYMETMSEYGLSGLTEDERSWVGHADSLMQRNVSDHITGLRKSGPKPEYTAQKIYEEVFSPSLDKARELFPYKPTSKTLSLEEAA